MEKILSPGDFRFYHYLRRLFTLIVKDRIPARATSLAFTTTLALVPLVTVFVSFGSQELLEGPVRDFITTIILPTSQEMVFDTLTNFAENSRKLGTWGLIITLAVVFLLINKIEIDVNTILRARPNRNFFTRLFIYLAILIFGTITVGYSFSLTNDLIQLMTFELPDKYSPLETLFSSLGSMSLIALMIFSLMTVMSSAKVRMKSALWGAFWGALLWELTKKGFSLWAGYSIRNSVIYGSFFLVPLLLIWINLAWIIILASLEITYFHQHPDYLLLMEENNRAPSFQVLMAIELYRLIEKEALEKRDAPPLEYLAEKTGLPEEEALKLLQRLISYDLIGKTGSKGYRPWKKQVAQGELMEAVLDDRAIENRGFTRESLRLWNSFFPQRKRTDIPAETIQEE